MTVIQVSGSTPPTVNFTRQELSLICLLLAAVITGGIVRLCRKGWTVPPVPPSITEPPMPSSPK